VLGRLRAARGQPGVWEALDEAKALADRALRVPQVRRVIAHVAPDNVASLVVLKRAGFHFAAAGMSGKLRFERAAKAQ
jgi:RimJ/RimL family protein N-acetyltransferase